MLIPAATACRRTGDRGMPLAIVAAAAAAAAHVRDGRRRGGGGCCCRGRGVEVAGAERVEAEGQNALALGWAHLWGVCVRTRRGM